MPAAAAAVAEEHADALLEAARREDGSGEMLSAFREGAADCGKGWRTIGAPSLEEDEGSPGSRLMLKGGRIVLGSVSSWSCGRRRRC